MNDPRSFAVAAKAIVSDGPVVDQWRLVVLLVAMEGQMGPQDAADICAAMGATPTIDAASDALTSFAPEVKVFIEAALAGLEDA